MARGGLFRHRGGDGALDGLFRPATLRLDAEGVHFTHWRYRWSVTWGDIAEVQLIALRINFCTVKETVVLRDRAGRKHTVTFGLTIAPRRLAALIRSHRAHIDGAASGHVGTDCRHDSASPNAA